MLSNFSQALSIGKTRSVIDKQLSRFSQSVCKNSYNKNYTNNSQLSRDHLMLIKSFLLHLFISHKSLHILLSATPETDYTKIVQQALHSIQGFAIDQAKTQRHYAIYCFRNMNTQIRILQYSLIFWIHQYFVFIVIRTETSREVRDKYVE